MPWQAVAGATLLIPSGPHSENHLYVVLNDPKPFPGYGASPCVVLVNVSTVREGAECDDTCILEPGCHRFIRQKSFVVYRAARIEPESRVAKLVKQGFFRPHEAVDAELLGRIKSGIASSPFTKREFKVLQI
jgi:hypothetical protein